MHLPSPTRLATGLAVTVLGLAAAVALPTAASAAEVDAIDTVTIVAPDPANPSAPLTVGQEFSLNAEWSVSDDAQPGDTFSLRFPSPIAVAWAQDFDLRDPDGALVGTCTASGQAVACTLGDYVLEHDDVHGSLSVRATAAEATQSEELTFETSAGTTVTASVPGGGIIADEPGGGPEHVRKFGGMAPDGTSARWAIEVPIAHLRELGDDVVLTDVYDERLTLDPASVSVAYVAPDGWDAWIEDQQSEALPRSSGEWTFADHPSAHSFDISFPSPREAGGWYLISYSTPLPSDAAVGDVFENVVTAAGTTLAESTVTYADADGNGSGQSRRSISVSKAVDGDGIAPDVAFLIQLDCRDTRGDAVPGYPKESPIRADETVAFDAIPVGAVCTLTEPDDGGAQHVAFSPSSSVTVSADSPRVIDLVVTNTFDTVTTPTPTPTPTPVETPAGSSETPAPTPAASSDGLATTGADGAGATIAAASILLLLGAAAVMARRRRTAR